MEFAYKFNVRTDTFQMFMETVNKSVHFVKFTINSVSVLLVFQDTVSIQQDNVFNNLLLIPAQQDNILELTTNAILINIVTQLILGIIHVQAALLAIIFYILDNVLLRLSVNKDNT